MKKRFINERGRRIAIEVTRRIGRYQNSRRRGPLVHVEIIGPDSTVELDMTPGEAEVLTDLLLEAEQE